LLIRYALPEDLPALRDLFLQSRQTAFVWDKSSGFELEDFDRQTVGERQLIALTGDRILGLISVWEPDNFIHHLHIHPDAVGRGVGRKLLRALPGWSTTPYQLKCVCENTKALAFYIANGFIQIGTGSARGEEYFFLRSVGKPFECPH